MLLCRDDAHTISIRILWGKCTTSVECKTIRIAVSTVMGMGMEVLGIKGSLVYKTVFQNELGKNTRGTGGNVPGRYGGKLEKLFWSY